MEKISISLAELLANSWAGITFLMSIAYGVVLLHKPKWHLRKHPKDAMTLFATAAVVGPFLFLFKEYLQLSYVKEENFFIAVFFASAVAIFVGSVVGYAFRKPTTKKGEFDVLECPMDVPFQKMGQVIQKIAAKVYRLSEKTTIGFLCLITLISLSTIGTIIILNAPHFEPIRDNIVMIIAGALVFGKLWGMLSGFQEAHMEKSPEAYKYKFINWATITFIPLAFTPLVPFILIRELDHGLSLFIGMIFLTGLFFARWLHAGPLLSSNEIVSYGVSFSDEPVRKDRDQQNKAVRLFEGENKTVAEIAEKLGEKKSIVLGWFKAVGLGEELKAQAIGLYNKGMSSKRIAEEFGEGHRTILEWLRATDTDVHFDEDEFAHSSEKPGMVRK